MSLIELLLKIKTETLCLPHVERQDSVVYDNQVCVCLYMLS